MAENTQASPARIPDLEPFVIQNVIFGGKKLGDGSYGTVEEVSIPGTKCAAKSIHNLYLELGSPEEIAHMKTSFVNECRLMSSLRHPHLVQFLGVCYPPDCIMPALVMERLHTSLHERLESGEVLSDDSKFSILIDVSRGLVFLHSHSPPIVHRDLTARNMLLTRSGVAKISDFGMARIVNILPGQKVGTMTKGPGNAFYMPPEANEDGAKYSTPIDIFSFGNAALFTGTQKFPDLKSATYVDPKTRMVVGRTEVDRREQSFVLLSQKISQDHLLTILVKECLHNIPEDRPTAVQILERLEGIRDDAEAIDDEGTVVKETTESPTLTTEVKSMTSKLEAVKLAAEPDIQAKAEAKAKFEAKSDNVATTSGGSHLVVTKVTTSDISARLSEPEYKFKVVLVGEPYVGKRSLLHRYAKGEFVEEDYIQQHRYQDFEIVQNYEINGDLVQVTLLNTGPMLKDRFADIDPDAFRRTDAAMIVYDISDHDSFDTLRDWIMAIEHYCYSRFDELVFMIVGNKCDLEDKREVPRDRGQEFTDSVVLDQLNQDALFIETSAKDSTNVEKAFVDVISELYRRSQKRNPPTPARQSRRGCVTM